MFIVLFRSLARMELALRRAFPFARMRALVTARPSQLAFGAPLLLISFVHQCRRLAFSCHLLVPRH
jgi:hypothetical protein